MESWETAAAALVEQQQGHVFQKKVSTFAASISLRSKQCSISCGRKSQRSSWVDANECWLLNSVSRFFYVNSCQTTTWLLDDPSKYVQMLLEHDWKWHFGNDDASKSWLKTSSNNENRLCHLCFEEARFSRILEELGFSWIYSNDKLDLILFALSRGTPSTRSSWSINKLIAPKSGKNGDLYSFSLLKVRNWISCTKNRAAPHCPFFQKLM